MIGTHRAVCIIVPLFGCLSCKWHSTQSGVQSILRGWWSDSVSVSRNAGKIPKGLQEEDAGGHASPFPDVSPKAQSQAIKRLRSDFLRTTSKKNNDRHHLLSVSPIIVISTSRGPVFSFPCRRLNLNPRLPREALLGHPHAVLHQAFCINQGGSHGTRTGVVCQSPSN